MKNNKGFTLIEILAVIILIGLIALLVVPKVIKTVKDSKKSVNEVSVNGLVRTADVYYMDEKTNGVFQGCFYNFSEDINTCEGLKFNGSSPEEGYLIIASDGRVKMAVKLGDECYIKDINHDEIQFYDHDTCSSMDLSQPLEYASAGYTGIYDGYAHGINVISIGSTIKYGTTSGTYDLDESPTYTDAGTYTVYYQITSPGYNTVTGSEDVTISKANNVMSLSSNSGTVTYPNSTSFNVVQNLSEGTLSCSSSNTSAATCSVSGTTVTVTPGTQAAESVILTITSAETTNYESGQVSYVVTSENGLLSVHVSEYNDVYDGSSHEIFVHASPSGATIRYGTQVGTYDLTRSPRYTEVGTYTVYYQVSQPGYTTVTGSGMVTIRELTVSDVLYRRNGKETLEDALDGLFVKFSQ